MTWAFRVQLRGDAVAGLSDAFVFASMHPNATSIHQRIEEHRPTTLALAHGQNVKFVLIEPLIDTIEMKLGSHNLIVIKQEDELRVCGIDRGVAPDTDLPVRNPLRNNTLFFDSI